MPDMTDHCFSLIDSTADLEMIELGEARKEVDKLVQDAGVVIDRFFNGYDPDAPAPGPETARLNKEFEDVTVERIERVLKATLSAVADHDKPTIITLMEKMGMTAVSAPSATPAALKKKM